MTHASARPAALLPDHLEMYRRMWVLRLLDMALEEMRADGLMESPVSTALGQEAVSIGATAALTEGDLVLASRRAHALHVGVDLPLGPMIAELIGQDSTCDHADQLNSPERSGVADQCPLLAVGHAYSQWLDNSDRVTLCITGPDDVNSGAFVQAANMAVLWHLPVVIVVESVPGVGVAGRLRGAPGHGGDACQRIPSVTVDGHDVQAVRRCVATAVQRARAGVGPTVVRAITYRSSDFPSFDGDYDAAATEPFLDPLVFTGDRLKAGGADAAQLCDVERTARKLVADAVALAKSGTCPGHDGRS
ncbi:thiamine pyrophosphate-dependent enzyme [Mycobacterium marinum]|uniref:thiamine pyrophosphate-dependent enzyme n=1 Tax=Mycobacterium marinum TaxID=1781 RepID=UPI003568D744